VSRTPRIYCPELPDEGGTVALDAGASRHLLRVLRLGEGADIRLFDGRGREHRARLEGGDRKAASARVLGRSDPLPESPLEIVLVQGVGRGDRMDLAVQKATELGVSAIVPVLTARSVVRLTGERAARRREHWQAVAVSACEQCGRAVVPEIRSPAGLMEAIGLLSRDLVRVHPDPDARRGMAELAAPAAGLALLVGPEGGLDEDERRAAEAAGFAPVRLGPRVLRTETAAIAAVTLAQCLWGDLGR
jgi:16S rRNA (uracil1498-N3)-methyltransferase